MIATTNPAGLPLPCKVQVDKDLKQCFDDSYKMVTQKWDFIILYVGREGAGKTTMALQNALYIDPSFTLDRVVFNPQQFDEVVENAPPYSSIVWDEADDLSSSWASQMLIAIKRKFKRIRKKNLFIFLVTPTFHDMNKYFAIHRTLFLFHVHAECGKRGFWRMFDFKQKRLLYVYGKKEMNLEAAKYNIRGTFSNLPRDFPIAMDAYEDKKDEATSKVLGIVKTTQTVLADYKRDCINRFFDLKNVSAHNLSNKQLAIAFDVSDTYISKVKGAVF